MADELTAGASEEATPTEMVETDAPVTEAVEAAPEPQSWIVGIEDEKVRKLADRYTSPAAMANALYEANRELSQRIKMPGEDASDEDRAKFAKALGVPETADEYAIAPPEGVDEERWTSDEYQAPIKAIVAEMHQEGASQNVVDAMLRSYFQLQAAGDQEQARADKAFLDQSEADLRKEWGASYDENIAFANDYLATTPDLTKLELRDGTLLGSHPAFIKRMAESGRLTNEGQLWFGLAGTDAGSDLKSQYDQLSRDIHAAYNRGDRNHAATLNAQRSQIAERLHGNNSIVGEGRAV